MYISLLLGLELTAKISQLQAFPCCNTRAKSPTSSSRSCLACHSSCSAAAMAGRLVRVASARRSAHIRAALSLGSEGGGCAASRPRK